MGNYLTEDGIIFFLFFKGEKCELIFALLGFSQKTNMKISNVIRLSFVLFSKYFKFVMKFKHENDYEILQTNCSFIVHLFFIGFM